MAQVSVQAPGAQATRINEPREDPNEVDVRINHELLQGAIEWALWLDGSRGASDTTSSEPRSLVKRLGLSFFIGMHVLACGI